MSDSPLLAHDRARGVRLIAGVDEVGAGGCSAGPVMAAGVLFDPERLASGAGRDLLEEVNDSKRLAPAKRERLAKAVLTHAEAVSLVSIPASQIDRIGLRPANLACLEQALHALGERAQLRFVDGYTLGASAPAHERIVRGHATSATVAAASIVAKVTRDRLMARWAKATQATASSVIRATGRRSTRSQSRSSGRPPSTALSFKMPRVGEIVVAAPARRRKPRASWRELPTAEMAAHLLETPTIADRVWTDALRLPRETRAAFIRQVLLRETERVDAPEGETAATEFET